LEHWDEFIWWIEVVVPKNVITLWALLLSVTVSDSNEVQNVVLAVRNHLVGDLDEKACHSLVSVVVSGDGVNHLDAVHQSWENFLDSLWVSRLKRFNELFESLEVLDVIFSLVQGLSDSELNTSPL
jgi:intracellular sulfur oxidation DsrE/DsrF family protein